MSTWADGYGNWHAIVGFGPDAAERARDEIHEELKERYTTATSRPPRPRVEFVATHTGGRSEWRERA